MNQERLKRVISEMKNSDILQLIISDPSAIFYLTGKLIFSGERMLVLYINISGKNTLFINELFPLEENITDQKIWFNDNDDCVAVLSKYIEEGSTVGIDKNWPSHFLLRLMKLKNKNVFVNGSVILDKVRSCKDEEERQLMRDASKLNDTAIGKLINDISEFKTEEKLADELINIYKELGSDKVSFSPIISYGKNGADPHHEPDASKLKAGDSIIIDIGCKKEEYCSDMTRTVFYKSASNRSKEIYNIVLEANRRAINTVKAGVRFCDIDKAARDYIEEKGYGKYFTHRTGHSIGIDFHETGDVSGSNTNVVEEGMVFSIEPGIYISDEIGVRIEDLVLVTKDGCEVLNKYNKELTVIE